MQPLTSSAGRPSNERPLAPIERVILLGACVGAIGALAYQVMFGTDYGEQWFALLALCSVMLLPFLGAGLRGRIDPFEPIYLVLLAYLLYFVFAPADDLLAGREHFFGFYILPTFSNAMIVAGLGIVALMIGYYARMGGSLAVRMPAPPTERGGVTRYGLVLVVLATLFFGVYIRSSGLSWTRFLTLGQVGTTPADDLAAQGADSALLNYLAASVDWYVAAFMIFFAFARRGRRLSWLVFIGALAIYMTMGFRYRIMVLMLAPLIYHFLRQDRRPRGLHLVAAGLLCWAVIGGVGELRTNFRMGWRVDPEMLTVEEAHESFVGSLAIYQPFIAVVDAFPNRHDFLGGRSYSYLLAHPIPRQLWRDKPEPPVYEIIRRAFESEEPKRSGVAYPNIGEFYADFGVLGVICGMLLFGVLMRTLYEYLRVHAANDWARIFFAIALPFLLQVVSRGYFVSIVQEAIFFLAPVAAAGWMQRMIGGQRRAPVRSGKPLGHAPLPNRLLP